LATTLKLDRQSIDEFWREQAMLPTVRWMESREFWAPEQGELEVALDLLERLFGDGSEVLENESRLRLLLLSLAYLRSGTARRISRFLDQAHPQFAAKLVDAIKQDLMMPKESALRVGAHVMASRIKHLAAVKVLSQIFGKERLDIVREAIVALRNADERDGDSKRYREGEAR
jgi:hypothetical protein